MTIRSGCRHLEAFCFNYFAFISFSLWEKQERADTYIDTSVVCLTPVEECCCFQLVIGRVQRQFDNPCKCDLLLMNRSNAELSLKVQGQCWQSFKKAKKSAITGVCLYRLVGKECSQENLFFFPR